MGVPGLFPKIVKMFPDAVKSINATDSTGVTIDNFLIDTNPLLHASTQLHFHYGPGKRLLDHNKGLNYEERMLKTFEHVFNLLKTIVKIIRPTKRLYIAIDGTAPIAKQIQQRQRRFLAAASRPLDSDPVSFNSNAITPGTEFMLEFTRYLNYRIRKEMHANGIWQRLNITFSPSSVAGEGEHKLMDYARAMDPSIRITESYCIFGPDGDLIMLGLSAHIPRMYLFRQDLYSRGYYHIIDMGYVRTHLPRELGCNKKMSITDTNNIMDDFVFIGFLLGNDFLPKIKMFHKLADGMDLMLNVYKKTFRDTGLTIRVSGGDDHTTEKPVISIEQVTKFVEKLNNYEVKYLESQASSITPPLDPLFIDHTLDSNINNNKLNYKKYRDFYYAKIWSLADLDSKVRGMCLDYLKGLMWVYYYYTDTLYSWSFHYKYHYAPLMSDLLHTLQTLTDEEMWNLATFDIGKPSLPFVQLLSVLPSSSASLLPEEYRKLMCDESSKLVKKGYYPKDIHIDYEGVTKKFMGVILLDGVDTSEVYKHYSSIKTKKYVRNTPGKNSVFEYDPKIERKCFISKYGKISPLKVRKYTQ